MCPFVDKSDDRCAAHMTLRNVLQAFLHCADRYSDCPVYSQMVARAFTSDLKASPALAAS